MAEVKEVVLGLDVGEKRIGVALGDSIARLAMSLLTINVDGSELQKIQALLRDYDVTKLVVGLPRNSSGQETAQSAYIRNFTEQKLDPLGLPIILQDESVTSILAEENLSNCKKAYVKSDIDAEAAAIILQDYLEANYAGYI